MEDVSHLQYRNIQLETELRLVKEQLAQAQSGTQYLVNCFSNQSVRSRTASPICIESRLHRVNVENAHLRRRLEVTQRISRKFTSIIGTQNLSQIKRLGVPRNQAQDLPRSDGSEAGGSGGLEEDELITFDDEDGSTLTEVELSPSVAASTAGSAWSSVIDSPFETPITPGSPLATRPSACSNVSKEAPTGLGIYNVGMGEENDAALSQHSPAVYKERGFTSAHEHMLSISDQRFEDLRAWQPLHPSPPLPKPVLILDRAFADHEHNRLMGSAVFIEDMSEQEREEHWQLLAHNTGRHSGKEWRVYYEEVVRPVHLARFSDKETSDSSRERQGKTGPEEKAENCNDLAADSKDLQDHHEAELAIVDKKGLASSMWAPRMDNDRGEVQREGEQAFDPSKGFTASIESGLISNDFEDAALSADPNQDQPPAHQEILSEENGDFSDVAELPPRSIALPSRVAEVDIPTLPATPTTTHPTLISNKPEINHSSIQRQPPTPPYDRAVIRRPPPRFLRGPMSVSELFTDFTSTDDNRFHTVLISNIPTNISLSEIISKVKGGNIVSATFVQSAGMQTKPPIKTNGAMIIFLSSHRAKAYATFCRQNHLTFYSSGSQALVEAHVSHMLTPTRPLHPALLHNFRERGLTRVLFIIDAEHRWTAGEVTAELIRYAVTAPLEAGRDQDGIMFFEFADVRDAKAAWNVVDMDHWFFGGASKGFLPDSCARALETILQDGGGDADHVNDEAQAGISREDTVASGSRTPTEKCTVEHGSDEASKGVGTGDDAEHGDPCAFTKTVGEDNPSALSNSRSTAISEGAPKEEAAECAHWLTHRGGPG